MCLFYGYLCRQSMAIPTLWEMDIIASHPLVTSSYIKVSPVQNIAHMKIATWIGWRSIYRVCWPAIIVPIVPIYIPLFPELLPLLLYLKEVYFL
jgi:hypothetical protein